MSDTPTNGMPDIVHPSPHPESEAWGELRSLIVGPEQTQLDHLQERLDTLKVRPTDVSQVLAEAIQLRSRQDRQLTNALLPAVEEALHLSIQRDPRVLVNTIFPMIGLAIRKAVAMALRSMLDSLNHTMEISLSRQGLLWRLEALRTGKSFGEVVLLHTLSYRVEQVFLIHRETGLLLQHVVAEAISAHDAEMISGMLTAIQDFMRDAFDGTEGAALDTVEYGEHLLWIEQGPYAILAGVVRHTAPRELKAVFQEALENVHFEMGEALRTFQGDAAPFGAVRHHLEACLRQQRTPEAARHSAWRLWLLSAVLLGALGTWGAMRFQAHQRWATCLHVLREQPGAVVFTTDQYRGTYFLSGLLDPLAPDPLTVPAVAQACAGIALSCQWHTYYALQPQFVEERARLALAPPASAVLRLDDHGVLHATGMASYAWTLEAQKLVRLIPGIAQFNTDFLAPLDHPEQILARARAILAPPATVTLRLDNGMLYGSGAAPHHWIREARQQAPTIIGIKQWREEQLHNTTLKELAELKDEIETYALRFTRGTVQVESGQDVVLSRMVATLRQLVEVAHAVGYSVAIEVLGHTDRSGSVEENLKLAQGRAEYVIVALRHQGLTALKMTAVGAGWRQPAKNEMTEEDRALNRRISLKVIFTDTAEVKG